MLKKDVPYFNAKGTHASICFSLSVKCFRADVCITQSHTRTHLEESSYEPKFSVVPSIHSFMQYRISARTTSKLETNLKRGREQHVTVCASPAEVQKLCNYTEGQSFASLLCPPACELSCRCVRKYPLEQGGRERTEKEKRRNRNENTQFNTSVTTYCNKPLHKREKTRTGKRRGKRRDTASQHTSVE